MKQLKQLLKNPFLLTLLIAVTWQLTYTLIGWLFAPSGALLSHMNHWDAGWYHHIIALGYSVDGSPAAPAFYPLFPLTVSAVHTISLGLLSYEASALIINTTSLWAILLGLLALGKKLSMTKRGTVVMILAFLSFPTALFLHMFYSEALFIAIGLWAYLAALNKRWWIVGVLLAILTAARLPALLFVALCGLEFLRAHEWNVRKIFNKQLLWFFLAPIGIVAYGIYLYFKRGDFLAMAHAYSATNDWTYHAFTPNIFGTFYNTSVEIIQSALTLHPTYEAFVNYALPLFCIILIAAAAVYLWKKPYGIPLSLFGILSIILFSINGNLVSVHRYALACIPLFIAVGHLAKRPKLAVAIVAACILSIGVQLFLYAKFVNDIFAG